jgi:hypothetical protein
MSDHEGLIPPPPLVRDRLARTIRECRLLRSLLRLSIRAAEGRSEEGNHGPRHEADRPGEAR